MSCMPQGTHNNSCQPSQNDANKVNCCSIFPEAVYDSGIFAFINPIKRLVLKEREGKLSIDLNCIDTVEIYL